MSSHFSNMQFNCIKFIALFITVQFCIFNIVHAQPVITTQVYPIPGVSIQMIVYDNNFEITEAITKSGPNQVWSITSPVAQADTGLLGYLKVEQTPYGYLFPDANIAMTTDKYIYDYFLFEPDGYYMLGKCGVDTSTGEFIFKENDKSYIYHFPMTYLQTYTESSEDIQNVQDALEIHTNKSRTVELDGYGTLIYNQDTFKGVLRMKVNISTYYDIKALHPRAKDGFKLIESVRYIWWSNQLKTLILNVDVDNYSDNFGEKKYHVDLTYLRQIPQYLNDKSLFPLEFTIHTDANKQMSVLFNLVKPSPVTCIIRDMSGREVGVIHQSSEIFQEGQHNFRFNAQGLTAGIYTVTLQSSFAQESIKIHIL